MQRLSTAMVFAISIVMLCDVALVAEGEPLSGAQLVAENSDLRGFVVTLALGVSQPGPSGTFTPAASKALADMKEFLPYKTYRPLDTAYIIGLNGPHLQLRGIDGQKHEFYMHSSIVSPKVTRVDMLRLWDVPSADPKKPAAALIDTSFKIEVGETVVVGTSRLDGGLALLLLVTAASK